MPVCRTFFDKSHYALHLASLIKKSYKVYVLVGRVLRVRHTSKMEEQKLHFRHILLFLFCKGHKAADAKREICDVYGASALSADTRERWFAHFLFQKFNLQNALRSGRLIAANDNQLLTAVKNDRHLTTREIAERFAIYHTIVRTD